LRILRDFLARFDFLRMKPDRKTASAPDYVTITTLSEPGRAYAVYISGKGLVGLTLDLPRVYADRRYVLYRLG